MVAVYDINGDLKAKYLYDAWGNCTITPETTDYDVANANPIRYRGYYFDSDTGLYYLNARYYSPKWRRFISPDSTEYLDPESINGLNLYCYCNNDPINYADPSGCFAIATAVAIGFWVGFGIGAIAGAAVGGIAAYEYSKENNITGWDMAGLMTLGILCGGYIGGAVGGAIGSAIGLGVGCVFGSSALVSGEAIVLYSGGGSSTAWLAAKSFAEATGSAILNTTFASKTLMFAQSVFPFLRFAPLSNFLWGKLSYDFVIGAGSATIFLNGDGVSENSIFYLYEIWGLLERGIERIIHYV